MQATLKPKLDRVIQRGVWCLVVGVFTSWFFGLGLVFILAAAVCGFIGFFRDRVLQGSLLLVSSLVLGLFCAHIAAVVVIFFRTSPYPRAATHISTPSNTQPK